MQVTFVTVAVVDLQTASFKSQRMGTQLQAKTSNFMKHMLLTSSCRYLGSIWQGPA